MISLSLLFTYLSVTSLLAPATHSSCPLEMTDQALKPTILRDTSLRAMSSAMAESAFGEAEARLHFQAAPHDQRLTPSGSPLEEEQRKIEATEAFATLWGGICEKVMDWNRYYLKSGNLEPRFQFRENHRRCVQVCDRCASLEIAKSLQAFPNYDSNIKALNDQLDSIKTLAFDLANARSNYYSYAGTSQKERIHELAQTAGAAHTRLVTACIDLQTWASKCEWFQFSAFSKKVNPAVLFSFFLPNIKGVVPDYIVKTRCLISLPSSSSSVFAEGDTITGISKVEGPSFTTVETWFDIRKALDSYTDKPSKVRIRLQRNGVDRSEIVDVDWSRSPEPSKANS